MTIPKYDALLHPILELLADGQIWRGSDIAHPLGQQIGLSDEIMAQRYESGHPRPIFADRVSWAVSLLYRAGLLDKPKRAHYQINTLGRQSLQQSPEALREYAKTLAARQDDEENVAPLADNEKTPQEQLDEAYSAIRQDTYREILDTILQKTPSAFEQLVVQLLQRMGYGGEIEGSARVTQATGDGGIDGEIREDVLGLGRIYIQAKRYQLNASIHRPEVQTFAGALAGVNANKGVFITTARFSEGARQYVQNLTHARIVLIDGMKLAEYIYDYNLGVQIEQTFSIKKLDSDFWENLPNNA